VGVSDVSPVGSAVDNHRWQNVLAAAADKRSEATYNDADAVLHEAVKIQEHLLAQDQVLSDLIARQAGQGGSNAAT
jgi:phosphoribosyl-ATP pyrophosphohydrolase